MQVKKPVHIHVHRMRGCQTTGGSVTEAPLFHNTNQGWIPGPHIGSPTPWPFSQTSKK